METTIKFPTNSTMNTRPTPITDRSIFKFYEGHYARSVVDQSVAQDLERKLAECRDALRVLLADVDHLGHWIPEPCRKKAEQALENTKP
jgi:hypothetical protein